jgi:hypothetical protein
MSAPINDGGPAFPSDYIPGTATTPGMTLRDWFAGQALSAIILTPLSQNGCATFFGSANEAYGYADAMIAARERKGGAA